MWLFKGSIFIDAEGSLEYAFPLFCSSTVVGILDKIFIIKFVSIASSCTEILRVMAAKLWYSYNFLLMCLLGDDTYAFHFAAIILHELAGHQSSLRWENEGEGESTRLEA